MISKDFVLSLKAVKKHTLLFLISSLSKAFIINRRFHSKNTLSTNKECDFQVTYISTDYTGLHQDVKDYRARNLRKLLAYFKNKPGTEILKRMYL